MTQTEGSCKLPFEASKANCIHPHRTRCLQHDVLPFELTAKGAFLCCYTPRPGRTNGCKSVCAKLLLWPPKNRAKGALKPQLPTKIFTYPFTQPAHWSQAPASNPVSPPFQDVSRHLSPSWSLEAIWGLREKPFIPGLSLHAGVSKCLMSAKHHKCCKWHLFCFSVVANKRFFFRNEIASGINC